MPDSAIRILWAEDNVGDILLIKEAFGQAGLSHHIAVVNNGADALDFLLRRGRYVRARRPDLIILDLNLPRRSGRELISDIKADPALLQIPLVILTSSNYDQDVLSGLDPKRSLYLVKASTFHALVDSAKQIRTFWLSLTAPDKP